MYVYMYTHISLSPSLHYGALHSFSEQQPNLENCLRHEGIKSKPCGVLGAAPKPPPARPDGRREALGLRLQSPIASKVPK